MKQPVYIYADESCLGNQFRKRANPGAAAGMLERFDQRRGWYRRDFWEAHPDTTNNRMAIRSAILALSALRRASPVVFTSDSQYLVKGMKEWVPNWIRRGWRRKGGPIENLELWQRLVEVARRHDVEWRWVRGHDDHAKNEYANYLATQAAKTGENSDGLVESGFDEWIAAHIERGRFVDFLDVPETGTFRPDPLPDV